MPSEKIYNLSGYFEDDIRYRIISGELVPGEKMFSVRYMARWLNTSTATIVKVYSALADEKFIVKKKSRYFVTNDKLFIDRQKQIFVSKEIKSFLSYINRLKISHYELVDYLLNINKEENKRQDKKEV